MSFHTDPLAEYETRERGYGAPHLVLELTNVCNLHCGYCLRDEDALYHTRASFFPIDLLRRVARESRESAGVTHVVFTGGETTLHPNFGEALSAVADEGLTCSFVTNGWHFERVWPAVKANRAAITHVAFSLDGATRESHDRWRGEGSFVRLVRAFARCQMAGLPFGVKVGLRRDTLPHLEAITMFAARMGASGLSFGHLLPTSNDAERELALDADERVAAEQEIALLARVFRMRVTASVGYYNTSPAAPCSALAGVSCNVDYRGRLSLCCNLSGYRGASADTDVVADLNAEPFAEAFARLQAIAAEQNERRPPARAAPPREGRAPAGYTGSPCLFCLQSFGKVPWRGPAAGDARTLPVLQSA